jgi:hypothetical protein
LKNINYTEAPELRTLAEKLKDRYPLYIGHADLDMIYFAEMTEDTDKPKPKKSVMTLQGLSAAWVKQLLQKDIKIDKRYCLAVWAEEWLEFEPAMQEWLMFDALYAVSPECDGKVRKRDVQEFGFICEFLGPYWRGGETDLESLLMSTDPLPIPVPPCEDEEGSTL